MKPAWWLSLAVLALPGCETSSHVQTISYPLSPAVGARERGFDCEALDDAVLKADAVRCVIRQDNGRLLTRGESSRRSTVNVLDKALDCVADFCLAALDPVEDEGSGALDRADRRLVGLLELKAGRGCTARPTGIAALTDVELGRQAASLIALVEKPQMSGRAEAELLAARTELLDGLRP